jgi:monofunctional biosynthetic peptidoglycan transglycosylase
MKAILNTVATIFVFVSFSFAQENETSILIDFNSKASIENWYVINDDVMGGISQSEIELFDRSYMNFRGVLSPENNGGFASIRSTVDMDAETKYEGVIIRVRGDGKIYSLRFRTHSNFDDYAYQAKIKTEQGSWIEYSVPFSDFTPTFRGRTLNNKPKLESRNIKQIGLLIADYQFGQFSLDIDWIKVY